MGSFPGYGAESGVSRRRAVLFFGQPSLFTGVVGRRRSDPSQRSSHENWQCPKSDDRGPRRFGVRGAPGGAVGLGHRTRHGRPVAGSDCQRKRIDRGAPDRSPHAGRRDVSAAGRAGGHARGDSADHRLRAGDDGSAGNERRHGESGLYPQRSGRGSRGARGHRLRDPASCRHHGFGRHGTGSRRQRRCYDQRQQPRPGSDRRSLCDAQ